MDDCLRYALVAGKKSLAQAGLGMDTDAFKALDKQRCAACMRPPLHVTPRGRAA